eukprot:1126837-Pelagomonas_calceolata.AAC.7
MGGSTFNLVELSKVRAVNGLIAEDAVNREEPSRLEACLGKVVQLQGMVYEEHGPIMSTGMDWKE